MVINTFNDCDIISTDSEECPSLLDGTNAFTGPRTSTPVKEEHVIDLHTLSFDDSHSQPSTVQSSSFPDSGSITPPDFSALIHSSLTFEQIDMLHSPSQTHDLEESGGSQPNDNHVSTHHHPLSLGYKIVIDNIDKDVKPRYMRIDSQKKSLHYVQIYSVKDRIDFSSLSESAKAGEVCLYDILPSTEDYRELKENFSILLARVMTDNLSFFSENFMGLVQRHVPHQYSCEMSTNSEVVSYSCYTPFIFPE